MSLHPSARQVIPADTAVLGRALLAADHPYRLIGDGLADLIEDHEFADLYSNIGGPALSPALLAMVTVLQMLEHLPDRLAAEAVVLRIDWKYALHLPLDDSGFHFSNLSHFRQRLLAHEAEDRVFNRLLERLQSLGLLRGCGPQRTDSTHVLGLLSKLSRLELAWETLRLAWCALQSADAAWTVQAVPEAFRQQYQERRHDYKLSEAEFAQALQQAGADGEWLLHQLASAPPPLTELPEVHTLRSVWQQQFVSAPAGQTQPRQKLDSGSAIQSPHEPEARYSAKRDQGWQGYRAQVSESAEAKGQPNFITDVALTPASQHDITALPDIQDRLAARHLQPTEQYVDQAYVSTQQLADSARRGICLMGPLALPPQSALFGVDAFQVSLSPPSACCPAGQQAAHFYLAAPRPDRSRDYVFEFGAACLGCALRSQCTNNQRGRSLRYHEHRAYFEARRADMQTDAFWQAMQHRPPIEGTISQLVRLGMRRARYRGLARVNLQLIFSALAVNLRRLLHHWATTPAQTAPFSPTLSPKLLWYRLCHRLLPTHPAL